MRITLIIAAIALAVPLSACSDTPLNAVQYQGYTNATIGGPATGCGDYQQCNEFTGTNSKGQCVDGVVGTNTIGGGNRVVAQHYYMPVNGQCLNR